MIGGSRDGERQGRQPSCICGARQPVFFWLLLFALPSSTKLGSQGAHCTAVSAPCAETLHVLLLASPFGPVIGSQTPGHLVAAGAALSREKGASARAAAAAAANLPRLRPRRAASHVGQQAGAAALPGRPPVCLLYVEVRVRRLKLVLMSTLLPSLPPSADRPARLMCGAGPRRSGAS